MPPLLWTVSYQGRSAEEIAALLKENGIQRVVHINTTAAELEGSRLEDELRGLLAEEGIEFLHLEGVGDPPEFHNIPADRFKEELTSAFEAYLSRRSYERERLYKMMEERPTAVLCYLPGERACHGVMLVQMHQARGGEVRSL